jgi:hypothetical protein
MAGKFERSWILMKASADVLRSDKSLLIFPLLAGVCSLLVAATFLIPIGITFMADGAVEHLDHHRLSVGHYIVLFLFYLVQYAVIIFFNTALVSVALQRLRGDEASFADGMAVARSRLPSILGYALIAATVGLLLRMAQERMGFIGRLVVGFLGLAWTAATFLVVPILANEEVGPTEAVTRSVELLKRTWGENLIGNGGIGFVFGLITVVAVVVAAVMVMAAIGTHSTALIVFVVALAVVGFIVLGLVQSSLQGIYAAALYRFADEGEAGSGFDQALLEQAFRSKS